jgi:small-conductance mechanosensitive channel
MDVRNLFVQLIYPETLAGAIFYAVVIFGLAYLISRLIKKSIQTFFLKKHKTNADQTASEFVTQLVQLGIYLIASILYSSLIPSLRVLGAALLATAGVASIVLGLAAQNTLGNIVSGISILAYRPIRKGDKVKVYASAGDETGIVESITLGYTTLLMENGEKIIVPNSVLASTVIVNYGKNMNA